jgi:rhodanese-related sulfurtransferase
MDPKTLAERRDDGQVVDVRQPDEWQAGRIDGALNIPEDELADRLDELDRARPVVTVCRTGSRSALAAAYLAEQGLDAENLDGGMLSWAEAGLRYATPDGRTGTVVDPEVRPDDGQDEYQRLQADFMSLVFEVQEHFGDHEPTEEEIRGFLKDRLVGEGRSPEDADEVLGRIDGGHV